jgi:hypothetical protein
MTNFQVPTNAEETLYALEFIRDIVGKERVNYHDADRLLRAGTLIDSLIKECELRAANSVPV